jgi:hypothetical protein
VSNYAGIDREHRCSMAGNKCDRRMRKTLAARQVAVDSPMLMLIRQNGAEEQGWRGTPFYWPVIVAQKNTKTAIFANETTP